MLNSSMLFRIRNNFTDINLFVYLIIQFLKGSTLWALVQIKHPSYHTCSICLKFIKFLDVLESVAAS